MSKYRVFGALLIVAAWPTTYISAPTGASVQIGAAAQAGVRWTPNPERGSVSSTLSGGRRGISTSACVAVGKPDSAIILRVPKGATGLTGVAQPKSGYLESQQTTDRKFVLSDPGQANPNLSQKCAGRL